MFPVHPAPAPSGSKPEWAQQGVVKNVSRQGQAFVGPSSCCRTLTRLGSVHFEPIILRRNKDILQYVHLFICSILLLASLLSTSLDQIYYLPRPLYRPLLFFCLYCCCRLRHYWSLQFHRYIKQWARQVGSASSIMTSFSKQWKMIICRGNFS